MTSKLFENDIEHNFTVYYSIQNLISNILPWFYIKYLVLLLSLSLLLMAFFVPISRLFILFASASISTFIMPIL